MLSSSFIFSRNFYCFLLLFSSLSTLLHSAVDLMIEFCLLEMLLFECEYLIVYLTQELSTIIYLIFYLICFLLTLNLEICSTLCWEIYSELYLVIYSQFQWEYDLQLLMFQNFICQVTFSASYYQEKDMVYLLLY